MRTAVIEMDEEPLRKGTACMKNFVLASMVLSGLLCAGLISAQEQKGPRIEVKEMQYNFGKVAEGTQVVHVFEIRNAGSERLVIDRIAAT